MFEPDIQEYLRIILDNGFSGHGLFLHQHASKRFDDWKHGAEQNHAAAQFFLAFATLMTLQPP